MAKKETKAPGAETTEQEEKKRGGFFRRLGFLLLVLVVVLCVAVYAAMEDGSYFASLRRYLAYGDSSQTQNLYSYGADPANLYGVLGEDLLVVSPNAIRLVKNNGTNAYDISAALSAPKLSVGGSQAVVCDVGGTALYVLDSTGVVRTLTADYGLCYYNARLNSRDELAVTEQKNGYKASVSVYNSKGELLFHFDSHDNYISDAAVTEDGKYLLAVALAPEQGAFASSLLVYDLTSAERISACSIRDGLVLDLALTGNKVVTLCDKRLTISDLEGQLLLDQSFGNLYLHDAALTGGDFCALLLGRYQSGNVGQLTTYDMHGQVIASVEIDREVLDMSAAGDYLAVLYSESLVLYDRELNVIAQLDDTDYAGHVRAAEDGTALVISGTAAWRFIP